MTAQQSVELKSKLVVLGVSLVAATASCTIAGIIRITRQLANSKGLWVILGLEAIFIAMAFVVFLLIATRRCLWRRLVFGGIAGHFSCMLSNAIVSYVYTGYILDTVEFFVVWFVGSFLMFGWLYGLFVGYYYHYFSQRRYGPCAIAFGAFIVLSLAHIITANMGRVPFSWHWYHALF